MASAELKNIMNEAIARELKVSIQYMFQHIMIKGKRARFIGSELRAIAIAEMLHAEKIAERLVYLGEIPTTTPKPVDITGTEMEIIQKDIDEEASAIELYKRIIKMANDEGDSTTRLLFEQILAEEELHHQTFQTLLGE
ncbi:ferritin-like domain-containing protein [Candidatus Magnetominusculus xianensis]|uniref:Ferritin n=1 Tax=Candidatus Magnetominusculus xianensis TaxID=1748249 RepID=A0ABR5SD61_9BACT|nr:ferritin-like domain-containing protein [Candidatus Magnetominusculus xianensis]KWT82797.1 ferritin [Candidatus Magnetominusculus xianensis]MBF0403485.1 ferritin-like domain-containing protein [Nitrospirota bacterium]